GLALRVVRGVHRQTRGGTRRPYPDQTRGTPPRTRTIERARPVPPVRRAAPCRERPRPRRAHRCQRGRLAEGPRPPLEPQSKRGRPPSRVGRPPLPSLRGVVSLRARAPLA